MSNHIRNTLLFSAIHLIVGNIVGAYSDNEILNLLFFPYSLISNLSAGYRWSWVSILFEVIGFIIMTSIFIPFSLFFVKRRKN
jgi:hypothetical protein